MSSTTRQRIARWIETHPWTPSIVFVLVPAICIVTIYFPPGIVWANAATVLALLLFMGFVVFLTFFRQEDRGSLGSSVPTLLGPFCTRWYLAIKADAPLLERLHNGGDTLIQVAFFIAGLIGLLVYQYSAFWEIKGDELQRRRATWKVILMWAVIIVLLVAMMAPTFAPLGRMPPPKLLGFLEPPARSPLTLCRIVLALVSVALATWPKLTPEQPASPNGHGR